MTSNRELRKEREAKGVCTTCGGVLDTDGKTCMACRKKQREEYRKRREWYASLGICPYCGKEKLYGEERECIECRRKKYEKVRKRRESMTAEKREEERKRRREYERELYQRAKKENICPRCGKRKPENGKISCGICLARNRDRARELYREANDTVSRDDRIAYRLCYICGKQLGGNQDWKVCGRCRERCIENLPSGNQSGADHPWRRGNALLFDSQMRRYCKTGKREGAVL